MQEPYILRLCDLFLSGTKILIALFFLWACVDLSSYTRECVSLGEHITGRIVRAGAYPVVAFTPKEGRLRAYRFDQAHSNYSAGDEIPIIFGPIPRCNVMADRGILNYQLELVTGFLCILLLIVGVRTLPRRIHALRAHSNEQGTKNHGED